MTHVYIIGVGTTQFGRHTELSIKDLTARAVQDALADAELPVEAIESAHFSNATQGALEGQHMIRGQVALRPLGLGGIPIINVENACASGATAFNGACAAIQSGAADIALAVGAEKMLLPDRALSMAVFGSALDVARTDEVFAELSSMAEGFELPPEAYAESGPHSAFMDVYASMTRAHMYKFGTTQRQIAAVSAKNHQHSVHNDMAQYRKGFTVEQVMADRPIAWPLTLPMCSPISDGAAAAVVVSEKALKRLGRNRAIRVLASVITGGTDRAWDDFENYITRRASRRAYEQAGIGPQDISLAEVHDATAFGEILQTEALGFCPIGEGGPLAESGATQLGGTIPVNVSGGLESKGHPIGATGLGQIWELTRQLRGEAGAAQVENARIAIAENGGGVYGKEEAAAAITILGRD